MTIAAEVLGQPGHDNALWVRVNSGQQVHRFLFDCGDGCLDQVGYGDLAQTDALLFSHLHMDHVSGFDKFLRCNYDRPDRPVRVFGPPDTSSILQHRFRGFWWNLIDGSPGEWLVHEVGTDLVTSDTYLAAEAFEVRHEQEATSFQGAVIDHADYSLEAITLRHRGPSLGYLMREPPRQNVAADKLRQRGLAPGPWMQQLKDTAQLGEVDIHGERYSLEKLRDDLLVETPGDSLAYLTDFLLDEVSFEKLAVWLSGCQTVVCEAQYRNADLALAQKHHHTTVGQVAKLAATAGVGRLELLHLSDRYRPNEWREMLDEAREHFAATSFPERWGLETNAELTPQPPTGG